MLSSLDDLRLGLGEEEVQGIMIVRIVSNPFLLHRPEQVAATTMTAMTAMTRVEIGLHLLLEEAEYRPHDEILQIHKGIETT